MHVPMKPNLLSAATLALFVCACGAASDEPIGEPEPGPEPPVPTSPAELAETRCASPEPIFSDTETDDYNGRLGDGYEILADPYSVQGEQTSVMCVESEQNRRVVPDVSVDARMFVVHNEHEGAAKMRAHLESQWSELNWADTHADYFEDFFEDGAPYTNGTFERATGDTDVLVLGVYVSAAKQLLEDLDVTYDRSERLDYFVSACGSGFVESERRGGGFLVMADISALPADKQRQLEALIDLHAPDGRLDIDAFTQAYREAELPQLSYWTNAVGGLNFPDLAVLGDDLQRLIDSLPQVESSVRTGVERAIADGENAISSFGGLLDLGVTPYSDEQIASTQLDEDERRQMTCYRDFVVEARRLLQRANGYTAEAKCYRNIYGLYGADEEELAHHARYETIHERLRVAYMGLANTRERCHGSILFEDRYPDQGTPCEECQIPAEFGESVLEEAYDELHQ